MSPKIVKRIVVAVILAFFAFSLLHASWLAPEPKGKPKLVASGPVDLGRDKQGCVIMANSGFRAEKLAAETLMLRTAAGYGAQGIVIEGEIADGKAVLPRFFGDKCARDNSAPRASMAQAMTALSKPDQFIRVKSAAQAKAALAAAPRDDLTRIFMGSKEDDIAPVKDMPSFSVEKARQCASEYRTSGMWTSVPESCANGTMLLTLDDLGIGLWGWPNRFMARMDENEVRLIIAAGVDGDQVNGLDSLAQYDEIARSFNGYIWVDNIKDLGPALKR